jgi:hypothetical protein
MSQQRAIVNVHPASALAGHGRLFGSLEEVFAVRFVAESTDLPRVDGTIVVGEDAAPSPAEGSRERAPSLRFADADSAGSRIGDVRVSAHRGVDRRLREVVLLEQAGGPPWPLDTEDEPLALGPDGPAWTRRAGERQADRVFSPVPALEDGMTLLEALHGEHSLGFVALVEFLRRIEPDGFSEPGVRCAFVFDDPNLRRNSYGYLDYRELVKHADDHGYHAAMAMIPLDARCQSGEAVALFRGRPDRLSLVMHGNNHSDEELMNTRDFPAALALGAQALRRIAWFEGKTGLSVDRVMMPPHASWSRIGARALGALRYDGLSATHPWPTTEADHPDRPILAGWTGVDFFDGCALIPRVSMSMDRTGLALRAFLNQPLVLYGHHGDLARGLEPLAAAAALVNGLGNVRWDSVGQIVQRSHGLRVHDGTVEVRPAAQRMRVTIPAGARELVVQAPYGDGVAEGLSGWTATAVNGLPSAFGQPRPVTEGEVEVRLHSVWETDPRNIASQPRSLSAVLQRRINEMQDRLAPLRRSRVSV